MAAGEPRHPHGRVKVDATTKPTSKAKRTASTDIHRDAWTGMKQDPSTYLTTGQLAKDLEQWARTHNNKNVYVYTESIYRWCKKWFGDLPPGRTGPGMGYRIPPAYKYIARVWWQTEDPTIRAAATSAILSDQDVRKNWVVTVANLGSTHYTVHEVASRVHALTATAISNNKMIHVLYVGDERTT